MTDEAPSDQTFISKEPAPEPENSTLSPSQTGGISLRIERIKTTSIEYTDNIPRYHNDNKVRFSIASRALRKRNLSCKRRPPSLSARNFIPKKSTLAAIEKKSKEIKSYFLAILKNIREGRNPANITKPDLKETTRKNKLLEACTPTEFALRTAKFQNPGDKTITKRHRNALARNIINTNAL